VRRLRGGAGGTFDPLLDLVLDLVFANVWPAVEEEVRARIEEALGSIRFVVDGLPVVPTVIRQAGPDPENAYMLAIDLDVE
jgi:hypothetical protein